MSGSVINIITPPTISFSYKKLGYRVVHVDGGDGSSAPFYSAIWEKRLFGPAYYTYSGMSSSSYANLFRWFTRSGYRLTHVSGYAVGNR